MSRNRNEKKILLTSITFPLMDDLIANSCESRNWSSNSFVVHSVATIRHYRSWLESFSRQHTDFKLSGHSLFLFSVETLDEICFVDFRDERGMETNDQGRRVIQTFGICLETTALWIFISTLIYCYLYTGSHIKKQKTLHLKINESDLGERLRILQLSRKIICSKK